MFTVLLFFRWICRRESDLPVLFLRHLDSSCPVFWIAVILTGVRWYCDFDLYFANNWWYGASFHWFLATCMSSLEWCLFRVLYAFLNWVNLIFLLNYRNPLYILDVNSLSWFTWYFACKNTWFTGIFSLFIGGLFILLVVFFWCTEVVKVWCVLFVDFDFVACAFGIRAKTSLPTPVSWTLSSMFSCRSFIVLDLTSKSLIPFKLIFCIWCKIRFSLYFSL